MSGYLCIRCGVTDDEARASGCARGPCPMITADEYRREESRQASFALIAVLIFAVLGVFLLAGCASSSQAKDAGPGELQLCIFTPIRQVSEQSFMALLSCSPAEMEEAK